MTIRWDRVLLTGAAAINGNSVAVLAQSAPSLGPSATTSIEAPVTSPTVPSYQGTVVPVSPPVMTFGQYRNYGNQQTLKLYRSTRTPRIRRETRGDRQSVPAYGSFVAPIRQSVDTHAQYPSYANQQSQAAQDPTTSAKQSVSGLASATKRAIKVLENKIKRLEARIAALEAAQR